MTATRQRRTPASRRTRQTRRSRRGRRRGGLWWFGTALLSIGLLLVGYVGWEMLGTNVVARHHATDLRQQTERAWKHGRPGPAGAVLHVSRFGSHYAVPIIDGFDDATLAKGIGRYPEGAQAGQVGNYVLAAHRVTHGQPFAKFPSLRPGDLVRVETRTATYTYRLRNSGTSTIVDFHTAWPLYPVPEPHGRSLPARRAVITLLTCSELFHTDQRSVVIGDLVRTTPRP